jgi:hydrogenase expression/formation protein HypE
MRRLDAAVQIAHGGGGVLSRNLIRDEIVPRFGGGPLAGLPDAARIPVGHSDVIFTTDSYVVTPLEFPGGNIGSLAVHGTVNDVAVCGGRPLWLSLALIMEEGLPFETLRRVLDTIRDAAADCGVRVVTGDTKVVAHGQCDGLFITTAGLGEPIPGFRLGTASIRPGDCVLASGTLGDHGLAVLAARHGIDITSGLTSDTAPVHRLVAAAAPFAGGVRFMRDPTRGGPAAVLNEIVAEQPFGILLHETDLPFAAATQSAAELLGLDLLNIACEGRLLMVCARNVRADILAAWHALPEGRHACGIGEVTDGAGAVLLETVMGSRRLVDLPQGEVLPRIC